MKIRHARGFTLIELLIVVAIIGIIAAIAVPGLLRARMAGNEASAIGGLRAISSGQLAFAASCGNGDFAGTLDNLGIPPPNTTVGFISPDLGTNGIHKSGYRYWVGVSANAVTGDYACNGGFAVTGFYADAHPVTVGSTGQRSFGTDARSVIFQDPTGEFFNDVKVAAATNTIQ